MLGSLTGIRNEMMVAIFHIVGMALVFRDRLNMSDRAVSAVGRRWFRWALEMLSRLLVFEDPDYLMARGLLRFSLSRAASL